jgi:hypothetical protein
MRQILELNPNYNASLAQALTPYPRDPKCSERYVADLRAAGLPEPVVAAETVQSKQPLTTERVQ